jgi:hypothetical protein
MNATRARRGLRFYAEAALAVTFALASCLLSWRPDWIEALVRVDPDQGSGLAEGALVLALGVGALLMSAFAWRERVRVTVVGTPAPVNRRV